MSHRTGSNDKIETYFEESFAKPSPSIDWRGICAVLGVNPGTDRALDISTRQIATHLDQARSIIESTQWGEFVVSIFAEDSDVTGSGVATRHPSMSVLNVSLVIDVRPVEEVNDG